MKRLVILVLFSFIMSVSHAQGDYKLQSKGKVEVTWRLVSDFQSDAATCWGYTYHIFISNGNNFAVTIKPNSAYQNNGDYTSCWQSGSVDISNEVIPAGKWREFTFRISTGKGGKPGSPGLKYNIDWTTDYKERKIDY